MTKQRRITLALTLIAGGALLAALLWPGSPGRTSGAPVEKIAIGGVTIEASALFYIALDRGLFADQGLDVRVVEYPAGVMAAGDLLKNELDLVMASEFVAVTKHSQHPDLRILAAIARSDTHEVIALRNRGITEPAHLAGKRIAVTGHSSGDFFLRAFLTQQGIPTDRVTFVDLPPPGILAAISEGSVDAVMAWEPTVGAIKQRLGDNAVAWPGQGGRGYYMVLLTRDDFLKKRPAALERLLRALIAAEDYAAAHPPEAQQIVAGRLGYRLPLLQSLWPRQDFRVRLDQDLIILMEDEARWAIGRKALKAEMPNFLEVIHWDRLKTIKPEAVGIIH